MRRDLEALLFAADQPLGLGKLASFFPDVERKAVKEALNDLREEYDRDQHAFTIVEFGGGYSISTRPEHAKLVRKLFRGRRKVRLSKAALECMAIIAYKQPVTRLEIEDIRGVSASGVLGTLMERDLVQIVGRAESLGSPLLYGTTKTFLDYLGLKKLGELPQLAELEDLLAEKEELKQLAARYGHDELSDEDLDEGVRNVYGGDEEAEDEAEDSPETEDSADAPASVEEEPTLEPSAAAEDETSDDDDPPEPIKAEATAGGADQ